MRQFLLLFALAVVAVLSVAGFRGRLSRRPPLEVFSDMDRQPRVRPQSVSDFFGDAHGSRRAVLGTVARGDHPADVPENTGRRPGSTQYVELNPKPVSAELLARGDDPANVLEQFSQRLTNKFLHAPTQALNQSEGDRSELQAIVSRLFHLHSD